MENMRDPGDAFAPQEVARRVAQLGVAKVRGSSLTLFVLAVLAGAFISLGSLLFAVAITGSMLGLGPTRLLGGAAFSLGLVLVLIAGAELFTGNNLAVMAWASRLVSLRELIRAWGVVYVGNHCGALLTAGACHTAQAHALGGGAVRETLLGIGRHKAAAAADPLALFLLAVLCNALVCLAVWLAQAGHTVTDRILGIAFPVTAFVALGFEHSIANMFFLPYAMLLEGGTGLLARSLLNLLVVTAGNILGGSGLVAGVYWLAYLRPGAVPRRLP